LRADATLQLQDRPGGCEIRQICDAATVILSSGYSEHDVVERFADLKPSGFLQKPYRPLDLLASIDTSMAQLGRSPPG
jgi:DNA-binding NarL/FixJ family response regulator